MRWLRRSCARTRRWSAPSSRAWPRHARARPSTERELRRRGAVRVAWPRVFTRTGMPPRGRSVADSSPTISRSVGQLEVRALQQRGEHERRFDHREVHADAHARPVRERDPRIARPRGFGFGQEAIGIEAHRVRPQVGTVLQRPGADQHDRALGHRVAADRRRPRSRCARDRYTGGYRRSASLKTRVRNSS